MLVDETFCLQTRLTTPIGEDFLSERGLNGFMHSDEVYGEGAGSDGAGAEYMDPNTFTSDVSVQVREVEAYKHGA